MLKEINTNRLRVVIVYHWYPHYRQPICELLCRQEAPGPEYTIVSDTNSILPGLKLIDPEKAYIKVSEGGLRWKFIRNIYLGNKFIWQKGLLKLAWSGDNDCLILLGDMCFLSSWPAVVLARLRGKRVLSWTHGFYGNEKWFKKFVREMFYRLFHGHLLYGNWSRKLMIEMGFDPDELYVVFNSLDYDSQRKLREGIGPDKVKAVRNELFAHPELPVLLFIGRLTEQKRLDMLIDAAGMLHFRDRPVNVLIVGEGIARQSLERQAAELKIEDAVVFFGACHNEQILAPLIMASDVCVSPGDVGLTAMHAMVYGTPVITHDNPTRQMPEFEAIVEGKSGQFFKEGSAEDLANVLENWLTGDLAREDVAANCRDVIDKYYMPHFQLDIINSAAEAKPASGLQIGERKFVVS